MKEKNNKRSLKKLVVLSVGLLLLCLLLGNFVLSFVLGRAYLEEQMQSHAQDAATALGLSISSVVVAGDLIATERMIDVVFDSGDYQSVVYADASGNVLIERSLQYEGEAAPRWFAQMLAMEQSQVEARVVSGWKQRGLVSLVSNANIAYLKLWERFQTQMLWFIAVLLIGLFALYALLRSLLRPLEDMERYAKTLSHNGFDARLAEPSTRELGSVAQALNGMSENLGRVFTDQLDSIESLRQQARLDPLTGLFNREGFDNRLKADLDVHHGVRQGALGLVMLGEFEAVNERQGRDAGDSLLKAVGDTLAKAVSGYDLAYAARRSGAQFSVFLPNLEGDDIDRFASALLSSLLAIPDFRQSLQDDLVHVGLSAVAPKDELSGLLSKADLALRQAQSQSISAWQRYAKLDPQDALEEVRQANHWKTILEQVLADNALILYQQPVYELQTGTLSHQQVLARIKVEGQLIVAGIFLPMAKRFGLSVLFDKMIVEKVLSALAESHECAYSITLSEASIADEHFSSWLESQLDQHHAVLSRVIFEVPEHALGFGESVMMRLCELGKKYGFSLAIDRFGISSVPFSYIQRVPVKMIKIDSSFVRDIHVNQDNQFFLRSAVQIAHSQNIKVLAIGVETEHELAQLKSVGVDTALGYYWERPRLASFEESGLNA
jgi:diguanylate cyclase (GGDEF)-like protein